MAHSILFLTIVAFLLHYNALCFTSSILNAEVDEQLPPSRMFSKVKYEIQYDIMRHHNFAREKQNLFEEMEYHAKVIPKVTKQIGRPKLDTSKIEKLWIEDYNLESLEPVDPLLTY